MYPAQLKCLGEAHPLHGQLHTAIAIRIAIVKI